MDSRSDIQKALLNGTGLDNDVVYTRIGAEGTSKNGIDISTATSQKCMGSDNLNDHDDDNEVVMRQNRTGDEEAGQEEISRLYKPKESRNARWMKVIKYSGLLLIVVTAVALFAFKQMGWFDNINRSIDFDDDGNAIEPNTKVKLPLVINSEVSIPGQENKKVKQHLIGMFLKVENILSMHLKVFVLGYYVQWDMAKKLLLPWKNKKQDATHLDKDLVDLLTDGESLPGTLRYMMTMTVPGSRMYDSWNNDVLTILKNEHVDQALIDKIETVFHQWLGRPLHNHDHFDITWGFNHPKDSVDEADRNMMDDTSAVIDFVFNDKIITPSAKSNEMIHAIVLHELLENGGYLVDLLPKLWEH